jgi:hypothetical protein
MERLGKAGVNSKEAKCPREQVPDGQTPWRSHHEQLGTRNFRFDAGIKGPLLVQGGRVISEYYEVWNGFDVVDWPF